MIEDGAELIVQRLEIRLGIGLVLLVPIRQLLILPGNHILGGDFADLPLPEIGENLGFQNVLLGDPAILLLLYICPLIYGSQP